MNSQICLRDEQSEVSSNFPQVKCDFCDIILRCDLDVSRHLVSENHRKNVDEFLALQNVLSKDVQKELPKNIVGVFKSLKLRHVKDLRDLADRSFFEIIDEPIAEIAEELATTLTHMVIEYEAKSLKPSVRKVILDALNGDSSSETSNISNPSVVQPTPISLNHDRSTSFPLKNEPIATSSKTLMTAAAAAPNQRSKIAKKTTKPTTTPPPSKLSKSALPEKSHKDKSQKTPQKSSSASTKSVNATNNPRKNKKGPPTIAPASATRPVCRPAHQPSSGTSSQRLNSAASYQRPAPTQVPLNRTNQSSTTNIAGTSTSSYTIPRNPSNPQPRLDTDYIPKLAIIKTEPKDKD